MPAHFISLHPWVLYQSKPWLHCRSGQASENSRITIQQVNILVHLAHTDQKNTDIGTSKGWITQGMEAHKESNTTFFQQQQT